MTDDEIKAAAWRILLDGAESHAEDWIDEEDEYGDDQRAVFNAQFKFLETLRSMGPPCPMPS